MKFKIWVKHKGRPDSEAWDEKYDKEELDTLAVVEAWGRATIDEYNNGLRGKEIAREFVRAEVISEQSTRQHQWGKVNLVTVEVNGRLCDRYRCERCGVTAKRYGTSDHFVRDSKWRAVKFQDCEWKEGV